jgi:hypothetical protein
LLCTAFVATLLVSVKLSGGAATDERSILSHRLFSSPRERTFDRRALKDRVVVAKAEHVRRRDAFADLSHTCARPTALWSATRARFLCNQVCLEVRIIFGLCKRVLSSDI